MTAWERENVESVRFSLDLRAEARRIALANGAGVQVNSILVTFKRVNGGPWVRGVALSCGKGWSLTVTSVPRGLRRNKIPDWLADKIAEVSP
jgi:hypothetical protein